jgi:hypothetical protein
MYVLYISQIEEGDAEVSDQIFFYFVFTVHPSINVHSFNQRKCQIDEDK